MKYVVFLGPPGVGKGTQAKLLCEERGWEHLSTGELLRDAVARETQLGVAARETMDSGELVGDRLMLGLIEECLNGLDKPGVLFDGFPRTLAQAEGLDELLDSRGESICAALLLVADEAELLKRLLARGRADDTADTVKTRLGVYREKTAPLIGYYRDAGKLHEVNGVGEIPAIHDRITRVLG